MRGENTSFSAAGATYLIPHAKSITLMLSRLRRNKKQALTVELFIVKITASVRAFSLTIFAEANIVKRTDADNNQEATNEEIVASIFNE